MVVGIIQRRRRLQAGAVSHVWESRAGGDLAGPGELRAVDSLGGLAVRSVHQRRSRRAFMEEEVCSYAMQTLAGETNSGNQFAESNRGVDEVAQNGFAEGFNGIMMNRRWETQAMPNTLRAVVRGGKIELVEPVDLPEGTTLLVTPLIDEDALFWASVSQVAFDSLWDNAEDDVYAQLLEE
jgi:hypothetical protein